jgi:hypothetical protein
VLDNFFNKILSSDRTQLLGFQPPANVSLSLNTSLVPPGGHHFVDRSTGRDVRINGTSPDDVAEQVLRFRLGNQKPPGNPMQELVDYVCGTWPHFCHESNPPPVRPSNGGRTHISIRVASWMAAFVRQAMGDLGVSRQVSEQRAIICSQCPKNTSFTTSGCGACQDSISRLAFVWKRDRSTSQDHALGACDITSQHNGCAVLAAKLPDLSEGEQEQLPANCWRKTTQAAS